MRAAVLHSPGDIRLETVPEPQVSADNVVVKVAACGVCGSDIPRMLSKGAHRMPHICGHEFSGHIVDIGRDVTGFAVGDLVAVPPLIACYRCSQCLRGEFSRCENNDYFGSRRDGAYSEFVAVPVTNLSKTPAGMDPAAAAMSDPAAIALHAVWKAGGCTVGDRGGIIGCGPIGLFAIQWLRVLGSNDVVAIDVSEQKLELARQAGATHTFLAGEPVDPDLLCDVVIEAAGIPASISRAIRMTAPGGHAAFIGIPTGDVPLENKTFQHVLRQEISLHGAWNSFGEPFPGDQWSTAIERLASGDLKWKFMITHDLTPEALPEMFESFRDRSVFFSKVLFRP